jgi:hypothetical protein
MPLTLFFGTFNYEEVIRHFASRWFLGMLFSIDIHRAGFILPEQSECK